uniref:CCZ1/INTU/HPS4 third Longin domain-containing protein n=1 Tax=Phytophthora ramorum TaxID=164328 RepID=H3GR77_PHYRM
MSAKRRVVVWHEADLTMIILLRMNETKLTPLGAEPGVLNAASLERLEDYLDSHQRFQDLAQLIFTRYSSTFAPEKSIPNLRPLPPFLYINRVNLAFRIQHVPRLLKSKEDDLFPVPVKLLAHYFPASTLALVNDLHAELHRSSNVGNREICVRTRHAGWVLAKKSETSHRELYVFFDSKISSVYDLSDSLQMLLHDQFGNVLF